MYLDQVTSSFTISLLLSLFFYLWFAVKNGVLGSFSSGCVDGDDVLGKMR